MATTVRKAYVPRRSALWWTKNPRYLLFQFRELSGAFVVAYSFLVLWQLWALRGRPDVAVPYTMLAEAYRGEPLIEVAKLEDGSYGTCDNCGAAIAPARLRVAPESVHCIACARR